MKITAVAFWFLGMISTVWAQTDKPVAPPTHAHAPSKNADDPLIFKSIKNEGTHILIEYSIPFEGAVDLELMDVEEKIIYRNQYANRPGDNSIKFSTKPLKEGKYFYALYYKGKEIRKYFDYRSTH